MPRPRLQREPCDCLDCREPGAAAAPPATAAAAVARQEPPPKSLVLCLDGALLLAQQGAEQQQQQANGDADVLHLDAAVAAGWAGLLASRSGGPPLAHQLLGLQAPGVAPQQSLADRFKQLRVVLLTDSAEAAEAGALAGCYAVHRLQPGWRPAADLAAHICRLLQVQPLRPPGEAAPAAPAPALAAVLAAAGLAAPAAAAAQQQQQQQEEEEGSDVIDMLLLALDASNAPGSSDGGTVGGDEDGGSSAAAEALEWADSLVRSLNQAPGFRDMVLLSLVVGPGQRPLGAAPLLLEEPPLLHPGQPAAGVEAAGAAAGAAAATDCLPVRRPLQSFQFAGLDRVVVDAQRPALVVHRLPGVIRVDDARRLELAHVWRHGGAGCILAERLLPEVAYKLGRAPKYGA